MLSLCSRRANNVSLCVWKLRNGKNERRPVRPGETIRIKRRYHFHCTMHARVVEPHLATGMLSRESLSTHLSSHRYRSPDDLP